MDDIILPVATALLWTESSHQSRLDGGMPPKVDGGPVFLALGVFEMLHCRDIGTTENCTAVTTPSIRIVRGKDQGVHSQILLLATRATGTDPGWSKVEAEVDVEVPEAGVVQTEAGTGNREIPLMDTLLGARAEGQGFTDKREAALENMKQGRGQVIGVHTIREDQQAEGARVTQTIRLVVVGTAD